VTIDGNSSSLMSCIPVVARLCVQYGDEERKYLCVKYAIEI
jgi:hypothetical protein